MDVQDNSLSEEFICKEDEKEHENLIEADIKNKMALAFHVLQACIKEEKAKLYSGEVQKLLYNFDISPCSEDNVNIYKTEDYDEHLLDTSEIDIEIREIIVGMYLRHEVPTIANIKKAAKHLSQDTSTLKQQLRRSGYIFKRMSNTNRVIIMEHPKQALLKQQYLTEMFRYRKDNRHIVYVMEKIITTNDKNIADFNQYLTDETSCVVLFLVASNEIIIDSKIFGCNSVTEAQERIEEYFQAHTLPLLAPASLIVLEDKPFKRKSFPVPTIDSEKKEMIKWLEYNNIPHDVSYHRSELFELIQRYKNKRDLQKFDSILKANGHDVIYRPARMDYLSYFRYIWCRESENQLVTPATFDQILSETQQYWSESEEVLISNEKLVFTTDDKVENIIERMINMANKIDIGKWIHEFDKGVDSLKQDEIIVKI